MTIRSARLWHGLTAVVAIGALVLQLALVIIVETLGIDQRARPAPEAWDPYRGGAVQS